MRFGRGGAPLDSIDRFNRLQGLNPRQERPDLLALGYHDRPRARPCPVTPNDQAWHRAPVAA